MKGNSSIIYLVVKLLFLCQRGRLDIQPTIAFRSTKDKESTDGDDFRIRTVTKYFDSTFYVTLRLSATNSLLHWSFTVHLETNGISD
jgi:hypothetical protein